VSIRSGLQIKAKNVVVSPRVGEMGTSHSRSGGKLRVAVMPEFSVECRKLEARPASSTTEKSLNLPPYLFSL